MHCFNLTNLTLVFRHLLTFPHLDLSRFPFIAKLHQNVRKPHYRSVAELADHSILKLTEEKIFNLWNDLAEYTCFLAIEIVLTLSRSVRLSFSHFAITGSRYCGHKMSQARVSDSIFFIQSVCLCCHLLRIRAGGYFTPVKSCPFWINIEDQNRVL